MRHASAGAGASTIVGVKALGAVQCVGRLANTSSNAKL